MEDNKNFIEELFSMANSNAEENDPNYDAIMENFKVACPVKKINLSMEEPNFINGMFLISSADAINTLKEKADLSNLNDDTLLFFTNQHIVEIAHILNGMLYVLEMSKIMDSKFRMSILIHFINDLKKIVSYQKYIEITESLLKIWEDLRPEARDTLSEISKKVSEVLKLIPFVSYSTLDDIAKTAIESYKDSLEKKDEINSN